MAKENPAKVLAYISAMLEQLSEMCPQEAIDTLQIQLLECAETARILIKVTRSEDKDE